MRKLKFISMALSAAISISSVFMPIPKISYAMEGEYSQITVQEENIGQEYNIDENVNTIIEEDIKENNLEEDNQKNQDKTYVFTEKNRSFAIQKNKDKFQIYELDKETENLNPELLDTNYNQKHTDDIYNQVIDYNTQDNSLEDIQEEIKDNPEKIDYYNLGNTKSDNEDLDSNQETKKEINLRKEDFNLESDIENTQTKEELIQDTQKVQKPDLSEDYSWSEEQANAISENLENNNKNDAKKFDIKENQLSETFEKKAIAKDSPVEKTVSLTNNSEIEDDEMEDIVKEFEEEDKSQRVRDNLGKEVKEAKLISQPKKGKVQIQPDGNWEYVSKGNFLEKDRFEVSYIDKNGRIVEKYIEIEPKQETNIKIDQADFHKEDKKTNQEKIILPKAGQRGNLGIIGLLLIGAAALIKKDIS